MKLKNKMKLKIHITAKTNMYKKMKKTKRVYWIKPNPNNR